MSETLKIPWLFFFMYYRNSKDNPKFDISYKYFQNGRSQRWPIPPVKPTNSYEQIGKDTKADLAYPMFLELQTADLSMSFCDNEDMLDDTKALGVTFAHKSTPTCYMFFIRSSVTFLILTFRHSCRKKINKNWRQAASKISFPLCSISHPYPACSFSLQESMLICRIIASFMKAHNIWL